MPEYVMGEDEDRSTVARRLLAQVGPDRADQVIWQPRADVQGGGVFLIPDDVAGEVGRSAASAAERSAPKGEYPYDGAEGGDPERRETDQAAQDDAANGEDPHEAEGDEAGEPAAEAIPTTRRRRATATTSNTDQQ